MDNIQPENMSKTVEPPHNLENSAKRKVQTLVKELITKSSADTVPVASSSSGLRRENRTNADKMARPTKKIKLEENLTGAEQGGSNDESVEVKNIPPLPEEMLEHIFSFLETPQEIKDVANSCSQFSRILTPSKAPNLFPEVLPFLFPLLDKKDIFSSRLVCKKWAQSVEDFLQKYPYDRTLAAYEPGPQNENQRSYPFNPAHHRPEFKPTLVYKDFHNKHLYTLDSMRRCFAEIQDHPRNPFLLRFICISNHDTQSVQIASDYWNQAFAILEKFGKYIWHTEVGPSIIDYRNNPTFNYEMLRKALCLMPNLRTLIVYGFEIDFEVHGLDFEQGKVLQQYIVTHPLPDLPYLHTIEEILDGENLYQQPVMNELMQKYSRPLRKLITTCCLWMYRSSYFNDMPYLTDLDLVVEGFPAPWEKIWRCLAAPNLAKLSLYVKVNWKISKLLQPLKENLPSLVYLKLEFYSPPVALVTTAPLFLMEGVKTLEILENENVTYDHVLPYFPRLEYLCVYYTSRTDNMVCMEDGEWEIRKWMLSDDMYSSNIWEKMKFLKEFIIARLGDSGEVEDDIVAKKRYIRRNVQ